MSFSKLGISEPLLEGIKAMGYTEPTPIQLRAIPVILAGKDIIGSAQTGTGKTAAFALPILSKLGEHATYPRVLILEPTRELAAQVETAIRDFGRFTKLRAAVLYGGVGYGKQNDDLRNGADIIIATPGRLLDHIERGNAKLDRIEYLVLDEADRIAGLLKRNNHAVAVLHSNRTQREREEALKGFRGGRYEVLVATDIAARGLDIADVSHVINYDVPQHPEDYIHRIGRTGRAESTGDAFTIMVAEDAQHVHSIERFIGKKIERVKMENFNYKYTALFEEGKPGQPQGGFPRKVKAVRLSGGGYFCAPGGGRRRR